MQRRNLRKKVKGRGMAYNPIRGRGGRLLHPAGHNPRPTYPVDPRILRSIAQRNQFRPFIGPHVDPYSSLPDSMKLVVTDPRIQHWAADKGMLSRNFFDTALAHQHEAGYGTVLKPFGSGIRRGHYRYVKKRNGRGLRRVRVKPHAVRRRL